MQPQTAAYCCSWTRSSKSWVSYLRWSSICGGCITFIFNYNFGTAGFRHKTSRNCGRKSRRKKKNAILSAQSMTNWFLKTLTLNLARIVELLVKNWLEETSLPYRWKVQPWIEMEGGVEREKEKRIGGHYDVNSFMETLTRTPTCRSWFHGICSIMLKL